MGAPMTPTPIKPIFIFSLPSSFCIHAKPLSLYRSPQPGASRPPAAYSSAMSRKRSTRAQS